MRISIFLFLHFDFFSLIDEKSMVEFRRRGYRNLAIIITSIIIIINNLTFYHL